MTDINVIAHRGAEIEGISGTVAQTVLQLDDQSFSSYFDIRRRLLRRRHKKIGSQIVQLEILIERDFYTFTVKIECSQFRIGSERNRRDRVFRSSLRTYPTVGTAG